MKKDTPQLICRYCGCELEYSISAKTPRIMEVIPCPNCMEENFNKGYDLCEKVEY